jgi:hypothetical protein
MQKVYSSVNFTMVYHVKNILATHGIESLVTGEHLAFTAGGVPPSDAWVDLWVLDERQLKKAQKILETAMKESEGEQ